MKKIKLCVDHKPEKGETFDNSIRIEEPQMIKFWDTYVGRGQGSETSNLVVEHVVKDTREDASGFRAFQSLFHSQGLHLSPCTCEVGKTDKDIMAVSDSIEAMLSVMTLVAPNLKKSNCCKNHLTPKTCCTACTAAINSTSLVDVLCSLFFVLI